MEKYGDHFNINVLVAVVGVYTVVNDHSQAQACAKTVV